MRNDGTIESIDVFNLLPGHQPGWAVSWQQDKYGACAEALALTDHGSASFAFRWIPMGQLRLSYGDTVSQPAVITIDKGFWILSTPVTRAQFYVVTGLRPSTCVVPDPSVADRCPVDSVSHADALMFGDTLTHLVGAPVDLPTAHQWEYACRAGTHTSFAFGENLAPDQAQFARHHGHGTVPVGSFRPNAWGVFDMHGQVMEWSQTFETFDDSHGSRTRFSAHGGCYTTPDAANCSSSSYFMMLAECATSSNGFRVIITD